jgi:hypothetical protein
MAGFSSLKVCQRNAENSAFGVIPLMMGRASIAVNDDTERSHSTRNYCCRLSVSPKAGLIVADIDRREAAEPRVSFSRKDCQAIGNWGPSIMPTGLRRPDGVSGDAPVSGLISRGCCICNSQRLASLGV